MSAESQLRERIERLVDDAGGRREARRDEMRREMSLLGASLERFEIVARDWMDTLVVPRLRTLASCFPNSAPLVVSASGFRVEQSFPHTEDFPVDAKVEARILFDAGAERIRLTVETSIIPILMDFEREGSIESGLESPDSAAVGDFLDERILGFVRDYLRVREPDSPHQRGRIVTDPVCGMSLRRAEAAASMEHQGQVFYFCVSACRDRFASDPDRYAGVASYPRSK